MSDSSVAADSGSTCERTIIVAFDKSEHSFYALRWVLETLVSNSPVCHDTVVLLHAILPPPAFGGPGYVLGTEMATTMEKGLTQEAEVFLKKAVLLCEERQIKCETKVKFGDARDVICQAVDSLHPTFLVLGSHGYGAIVRAFLGSVSDYCAHHAKCPVIIVKKPHTTQHN